MCSNPCWLELTGFRPESKRGPADNLNLLSPALFSTELWWLMHHQKSRQTLLLINMNASCSRIPPQESRTPLPLRRWATTRCRLSLRPCTAPLSCSLQPLLKLSFLSFRPSLLQFASIVSLLLNHRNVILEPVCAFYLFLVCLCICDRTELQR